jgi:hypothetical protein
LIVGKNPVDFEIFVVREGFVDSQRMIAISVGMLFIFIPMQTRAIDIQTHAAIVLKDIGQTMIGMRIDIVLAIALGN